MRKTFILSGIICIALVAWLLTVTPQVPSLEFKPGTPPERQQQVTQTYIAKQYLYELPYLLQRHKGLDMLESMAAGDKPFHKQAAIMTLYDYYKTGGTRFDRWLKKDWHITASETRTKKAFYWAEQAVKHAGEESLIQHEDAVGMLAFIAESPLYPPVATQSQLALLTFHANAFPAALQALDAYREK